MPQTPSSESTVPLPLSRERILQVALQKADTEGIEALSMRKLAQALGVKAMSLYNHVAHKDDMVDGMVDLVVGEIELPSLEVNWKTAMRQRAISAHTVLLRHPWATLALMSRVNVGPAMLRYVDATLACLVEAGFSYPMADYAWNALDSHIYGFTLQALNFPFEAEEYAAVAKDYVSMVPPEKYPYLNQLTHQVMDGRHDGLHNFEFGLSLLLDGLATWVDSHKQ
ncbi:TetR/AcrR family transcriptional regulator C-terminal domain-containing protein [Lyngbya confervoides]|uniref:TetR/AcrR family transcriptional regulator n=1 Tax=Lyngbya confervoides BDU141951 TaxID=1574623 RepID=A0ABD4T0X4_9CYAN|nr:TetR/AcrR family transcriptional regulator C-terminal domain-containing protein [Lyngbya confervoides]MCM1982278.1 TetR/AcrR family transcriptional regulator [Lyngbya confervoides BDU141951]